MTKTQKLRQSLARNIRPELCALINFVPTNNLPQTVSGFGHGVLLLRMTMVAARKLRFV
jgi:hypothetical protein